MIRFPRFLETINNARIMRRRIHAPPRLCGLQRSNRRTGGLQAESRVSECRVSRIGAAACQHSGPSSRAPGAHTSPWQCQCLLPRSLNRAPTGAAPLSSQFGRLKRADLRPSWQHETGLQAGWRPSSGSRLRRNVVLAERALGSILVPGPRFASPPQGRLDGVSRILGAVPPTLPEHAGQVLLQL